VKRTFYPWLCEILISFVFGCGWIKEVFLFLPKAKSKLSEGRGLISRLVRVGRKEKLKFGRSQATSGLREVGVADLGERVQRSEPLNPC
jgi:hypothetical protein